MGSRMCLSKGPKTDSPPPSLPPWTASELLKPALPPRGLNCPTHGMGWGLGARGAGNLGPDNFKDC